MTTLDKAGIIERLRALKEILKADGQGYSSNTVSMAIDALSSIPEQGVGKFNPGDRVQKKSGSEWHGRVCGAYSTELTPEGYCIESEREKNSVQNYPAAALEIAPSHPAAVAVTDEMVEIGPDGKEWAKTEAGFAHVESIRPGTRPEGNVYYGHAVREAFVAGAEWQERRAALVDLDRVK